MIGVCAMWVFGRLGLWMHANACSSHTHEHDHVISSSILKRVPMCRQIYLKYAMCESIDAQWLWRWLWPCWTERVIRPPMLFGFGSVSVCCLFFSLAFHMLCLSCYAPLIHQYDSLGSWATHRLLCSQVVFLFAFDSFVHWVDVVVAVLLLLGAGMWLSNSAHLSLYECWSSEVDKLHIIENNRWINKLQGVNNHTSFFLLSDLQSFLRHSPLMLSVSSRILYDTLLFFCVPRLLCSLYARSWYSAERGALHISDKQRNIDKVRHVRQW